MKQAQQQQRRQPEEQPSSQDADQTTALEATSPLMNAQNDEQNDNNESSSIWSPPPSLIRVTKNPSASDCFIPFQDDAAALEKSRRIRHGERPHYFRRVVVGGIAGGLLTLCLLGVIYQRTPSALEELYDISEYSLRGEAPPTGIVSYLNLFGSNRLSKNFIRTQSKRKLAESSFRDPQLVIAGKMTVEDAPCNIAQYNLKNNEWSLSERIQLSLYNSYSGGEVYSLLANHTNQRGGSVGSDPEDAKR
jgi:hypothetical protein